MCNKRPSLPVRGFPRSSFSVSRKGQCLSAGSVEPPVHSKSGSYGTLPCWLLLVSYPARFRLSGLPRNTSPCFFFFSSEAAMVQFQLFRTSRCTTTDLAISILARTDNIRYPHNTTRRDDRGTGSRDGRRGENWRGRRASSKHLTLRYRILGVCYCPVSSFALLGRG